MEFAENGVTNKALPRLYKLHTGHDSGCTSIGGICGGLTVTVKGNADSTFTTVSCAESPGS